VVAFLAANAVLAVAAVVGGFDPLSAHRWSSFDSPIYLTIAEHGYQARTCPQWELDQGATACGNFGWFPLYALPVRALMEVGLAPETAGLLVALVFWLGLLIALWNGLLLVRGGRAQLPALALAAFMPGVVYLHGIYPMSMAVFFLVLVIIALSRERWAWAGLAAALATATYPGSATVALVAGLWLLFFVRAPSLRVRAGRIALVCVPALAGIALVLLYAQLKTGQWDGYFGVQARFHHGVHFPFANWKQYATPVTTGLGHISIFLAFQAWLVTLLVGIVVVATVLRRHAADALDWLLVLWALCFWLVPLAQNAVSYQRTDVLLLPIAVAVARRPPLLVWALALAGAFVAAGMTLAYMQGVLV
jgi:hypothetical protein